MPTFLNTTEWLEFQKVLGRKAWRYERDGIAANIIRHDLPFKKNYLYIPHGPELDLNRMLSGYRNELNAFAGFLGKLAAENKSVFIKFEPLRDVVPEFLHSAGLTIRPVNKHIQPSRTVVLDLSPAEEEILSRMHHKTRYNIKVAQGHGVTVRFAGDTDSFLDLLKKTTERDKFSAHPNEYYKKLLGLEEPLKTELFLAHHQGKPVAGAIVLTHGDMGYYLHGASDNSFRQFMAPHLLHWDIIKTLRERGVKRYDLWGIDARRWPGVTRFKLGFGGRQVEYPGSFDIPVRKFWYWLYNLRQKFR